MSTNPPNPSSVPAIRPSSQSRRSSLWIWLILLMLLGAAGYYSWTTFGRSHPEETNAKPKNPPLRVTTAPVHHGDIGVYLTALGSVEALNTVTVKTRVDGQLIKVNFTEGQLVQENDLLAEIDPRPYQVQLEQAEGQLARDQATLQTANLDKERYKTLWSQNSIAKQTLDTQEGVVSQAEGTIKSDQAQIDSAKLSLTYCQITSPISGRVGLRLVDAGNIVHAADTGGLVVVTQLQPINVSFTLSEDSLPPVLKKLNEGEQLSVEIKDRENINKLAVGVLASADNQIDATTGTLKFKSLFPNADFALFPNQFVNARLLVETKKSVVLAPVAAVQRGVQNNYAYVLKPDNTVTVSNVTLGVTNAKEIEILSGLTDGQVVVVDGVDKLQEGSHVVPSSNRANSDHNAEP